MTTTVTETADAPARHKAVATELPPARGQSFLRLVGIEIRKSVDTRSGRVMIAGILALALAGLAWRLVNVNDSAVTFERFLSTSAMGVQLLLPVIGIMAMTSEWTQRTALTTFTLSPRRVRVQLAKFVAAILLSAVVLSAVVLLALGGTALGGALADGGATYTGLGGDLAALYLVNALNVVMGAAFGAVIAQTAAAVLVFFIAPTLWSLAGPELFKERADWLDVFGAFTRIASRDLQGLLPESLTAITVWIVIPTVVGLVISTRREVK